VFPARRLLPPLLIAIATAANAVGAASAPSPGLTARLSDLRARSQPDSVEMLVAEALPVAAARGDSALAQSCGSSAA